MTDSFDLMVAKLRHPFQKWPELFEKDQVSSQAFGDVLPYLPPLPFTGRDGIPEMDSTIQPGNSRFSSCLPEGLESPLRQSEFNLRIVEKPYIFPKNL
jgi:hypothetical protein